MDHGSPDSLAADAAAASAALEAYLQGTLSLPDAEVALRRVDGQMSFDAWLDGAPSSPADEAVLARYAAPAARLGWALAARTLTTLAADRCAWVARAAPAHSIGAPAAEAHVMETI